MSPTRVPEVVLSAARALRYFSHAEACHSLRWVFLGPPGVGKGTYASRVADAFGLAHIAVGDLVRAEIKNQSQTGQQIQEIVRNGKLIPDSIVMRLLDNELQSSREKGEKGFILDGFPRTLHQAGLLKDLTDVQLALNLSLRQDVLVSKCLGRRICSKCGKNYNIANIAFPAKDGLPAVYMPPLDPPKDCMKYMEKRDDDTEEVVRKRFQVYEAEAAPIEQYFRDQGKLIQFEITQGIPETLPQLLQVLQAVVVQPTVTPHIKEKLELYR